MAPTGRTARLDGRDPSVAVRGRGWEVLSGEVPLLMGFGLNIVQKIYSLVRFNIAISKGEKRCSRCGKKVSPCVVPMAVGSNRKGLRARGN